MVPATALIWSIEVHHGLFNFVDIELQVVFVAPCDQALDQFLHIWAWTDEEVNCNFIGAGRHKSLTLDWIFLWATLKSNMLQNCTLRSQCNFKQNAEVMIRDYSHGVQFTCEEVRSSKALFLQRSTQTENKITQHSLQSKFQTDWISETTKLWGCPSKLFTGNVIFQNKKEGQTFLELVMDKSQNDVTNYLSDYPYQKSDTSLGSEVLGHGLEKTDFPLQILSSCFPTSMGCFVNQAEARRWNMSRVTPVGDSLSMSSGAWRGCTFMTDGVRAPTRPCNRRASESGSEAPAGPLDSADLNWKCTRSVTARPGSFGSQLAEATDVLAKVWAHTRWSHSQSGILYVCVLTCQV